MINPNATSIHYGRVVEVSRDRSGSLNIKVLLESGHIVEELGFIYHKTVSLGDIVIVLIGYSIVSDRYGIKAIKRMQRRNPRYKGVENRINRHGFYTADRSNLKAVSRE
jgi:hypothetical protein